MSICPHIDRESADMCQKCNGWCQICQGGTIDDFNEHMRKHEVPAGVAMHLGDPEIEQRDAEALAPPTQSPPLSEDELDRCPCNSDASLAARPDHRGNYCHLCHRESCGWIVRDRFPAHLVRCHSLPDPVAASTTTTPAVSGHWEGGHGYAGFVPNQKPHAAGTSELPHAGF